jgi:hypothetical protein
MKINFIPRRQFIRIIGMAASVLLSKSAKSATLLPLDQSPILADFVIRNGNPNPGNFKAIYLNEIHRDSFRDFLVNVYHLYPENEFHELIHRCSKEESTDEAIYAEIQKALPEIKPFLADLLFSLPALFKQKNELARETLELLSTRLKKQKDIKGYLEIGTTGRYLSELKHHAPISGDIILLHHTAPSYSPEDIAERGGIQKVGRHVPLADYAAITESQIPTASLDVVANYIGFHHSPLDRLDAFVRSIGRVLKKDGSLILRDHDVNSETMNSVVALAHDVFNAGLMTPWNKNHSELRHFRSIDDWVIYLEERGLQFQGKKILQPGDPTKNTLMEFKKV